MPHRISIMGAIGAGGFFFDAVSAQEVAAAFDQLPDDRETLTISPYMSIGGEVSHGEAIRQMIEDEATRRSVIVEVYGAANSIAAHAVIGARGATVKMTRGAQLGIHSPWMTIFGASATELETNAEGLRKTAAAVAAEMVHRAPKLDEAELVRMLTERSPQAMNWVPADEAIALGLADGIVGDPDPAAEAAAAQMLADIEQAEEEEPEAMAAAGDPKPIRKEGAMALPLKKKPEQPASTAAAVSSSAVTESPPEGLVSRVTNAVLSRLPGGQQVAGTLEVTGQSEQGEGVQGVQVSGAVAPVVGAQASMPLQSPSQAPDPGAMSAVLVRNAAESYADGVMASLTHLSPTMTAQNPREGLARAQAAVIRAQAGDGDVQEVTQQRDLLQAALRSDHDGGVAAAQALTTSNAGAPTATGGLSGEAGAETMAQAVALLREMKPNMVASLAKRAAAGDPNFAHFADVTKADVTKEVQ